MLGADVPEMTTKAGCESYLFVLCLQFVAKTDTNDCLFWVNRLCGWPRDVSFR